VREREKEKGEITLVFTGLMAAAEPAMEMDNSIAIQSKRESFCFRQETPGGGLEEVVI
jgi:hypothetical protein